MSGIRSLRLLNVGSVGFGDVLGGVTSVSRFSVQHSNENLVSLMAHHSQRWFSSVVNEHRYTLAILKPDVVSTLVDQVETQEDADIIPSILQKIREEGFEIAKGSTDNKVSLTIEQAEV